MVLRDETSYLATCLSVLDVWLIVNSTCPEEFRPNMALMLNDLFLAFVVFAELPSARRDFGDRL